MNFWEKMQYDLKRNIQEGIDIVKEGSAAVTEKIEQFTEGGKKKYQSFNLNMKVQEEFSKLGGEIYDLTVKKSKNPLSNKKVVSIITKINKLENQITKLEDTETGKTKKTTVKKTTAKKRAGKKTTAKKTAAKKTKRKTAPKTTKS